MVDPIRVKISLESLTKHTVVDEGKSLEEIELPKLEPIEQAYKTAESRSQRSRNLRFLENYLNQLKKKFL